MPFTSLHDFVERLARAGELQTVSATVDPHLEISEISNRAVKAGGP
ncbi:MAG: UbiD family decarboxylase, partial [Candidatus Eremiobacteraeota bacterium]|nr:UbiD family decarboxylase [Candidatus Eremiobacteraeota bacterium]